MRLFFNRLLLRTQSLVMLPIDVLVELELRPNAIERARFGMENEIDVVSAIERTCHVAELAPIESLDLFDLRALFGEVLFEALDDLFRTFVVSFDIKDEKSFVSVFHRMAMGFFWS